MQGPIALKYIHGPGVDEALAVDDGTESSYFHADGLGSAVKMTSAAGAVVLTREHDPWGYLQTGAAQTGYAFTGREWDPEIGLYHYRARSYDASLGRFISEDPIGIAGGVNLYSYVANNPTNWLDPSGQIIQLCSRPAQDMPGNHAYLYDPATGRNCGRGDNSGKECPDREDTTCADVPGTEGKEDLVMACCDARRRADFSKSRNWRPFTNDCHNFNDNVLECAGIKNPPAAPGGRFGNTHKKPPTPKVDSK